MGSWIDIVKVEGGFEYKAGQLVIARSRWVKRGGEWKLSLITLTQCDKKSYGILAAEQHKSYFTPTEIMDYLQNKTISRKER